MALNFMNSILPTPFKVGDYAEPENSDEVQETPASCVSLPVVERPLKMQVFLRLRPNTEPKRPNMKNCGELYAVGNPSTLLVKHFSSTEAARYSKPGKSNLPVNRKKYTFTRIFNHEIDQQQFFNESVKPTVIDFLNNRSSTVICYGTTGAGKTYGMFGSPSNPGIVPRTIEFIYSSINCTLTPWYKPKKFCSVVNLNEGDRTIETATREKLLNCRLVDSAACEESYEKLESSSLSSNQEIFKDSMYSVWISFVEIYNENIYDLLEVDEDGKNMQLKLAVDKQGFTYIQDMRSVSATTGLEAYEIMQAGQSRLSTVPINNYKSSRSHSIFIIKLLKYNKDSSPFEVQVTSMSFYDLAGTGRIQKAIRDSKELKETRSINTSLLALGRCFKFMSQDYHSRRSSGPFRDSKLTRLFQHSLCGYENILLLVNINPALELYAETQNVLSFSTTAMKLSWADSLKDDKKLDDFYSPLPSPKIQETRSEIVITPQSQEVEILIHKNNQLETQLRVLKNMKLKHEYDVRKELANLHSKQMNDLEQSWKNRMSAMKEEKENLLQFAVSKVRIFYENKLGECNERKRKRSDRGDFEDRFDPALFEKGEFETSPTKKLMESLKSENKELVDQKNKCLFELSLLKKWLKKVTDSAVINDPEETENLDSIKAPMNEDEVKLDEEVVRNLAILKNITAKLQKSKKDSEDLKKIHSAQEIQCDSLYSIIAEFCEEIQNLVEDRAVKLPDLDNSLDSVEEINDKNNTEDFTTHLCRLKELVVDKISKIKKLECENSEKNEEIENLKKKILDLEKKNLQLEDQYQESESSRLTLTKNYEELMAKLHSKELFANHEIERIESENSLVRESSCQTISLYPLNQASNEDLHLSLYDEDSDKDLSRERVYSSDSSKNDSGLHTSIECSDSKETVEESSQTNVSCADDKFEKLKREYHSMKSQHDQETQKVTELYRELNSIKETMRMFKEHSSMKEQVINEYRNQLSAYSSDLELVRNQKQLLEIKCDDLTQKLMNSRRVSENKSLEVQKGECPEECQQMTVGLKSELSIAYSQIEKASVRCFKEHVLKIHELEKELNRRKLSEATLEEKIVKYEIDLFELNELSEKVSCFENFLQKMKKEKEELRKLLSEQTQDKVVVEEKVKYLVERVGQRDEQIQSLKTELNIISRTNNSNIRKAKEYGKDISEILDNTSVMREKIKSSEDTWKDLEQNSTREINNLHARLAAFEENAQILNTLCNSHDSQRDEVEKLKAQLIEQEHELDFYKKNRNATIQRYECLVRQLQNTLKANNHTSRLRRIFPHKHKYFPGLKEPMPCDQHVSEPVVNDWKLLNVNHNMSFSCSGLQMTQSISENLGTFDKAGESLRLIGGVRKKSFEVGKKFHLKKSRCSSIEEEDEVSSNCLECPARKSDAAAGSEVDRSKSKKTTKSFFLHRRKSSKDWN